MVLTDPMREAFAVAVARLKLSNGDAARHAGYDVASFRQKGYDLSRAPDINARIAELRETIAQEAVEIATDIAVKDELERACEGLDPNSREWLLVRHRINLRISESRKDTKEVRATLQEIAVLNSLRVERKEVAATNTDALTIMTAAEIDLLRTELRNRLSVLRPAPVVIEGEASDEPEAGADV